MSRLIIRILERKETSTDDVGTALDSVDHNLQWAWIRRDQSFVQGETTASALSTQLAPLIEAESDINSITVVIPSEQVLMLSCSVPGRNSGQIRQALPYALEEHVATDIETMHIAVGPIKSGQPIHCALIEYEQIGLWKSWLANYEIDADVLVSQAQLASSETNDCTVFIDGHQATIVNNQASATFEREDLVAMLEPLEIDNIFIIGSALTDLERSQIDTEIHINEQLDGTAYLVERLTEDDSINLFQGKYAVENSKGGVQKQMTKLAKLAALWLVVYLGGLAMQGGWLSYQADQLAQANRESYAELFPQDSIPITTAQLRRRLENKIKSKEPEQASKAPQFVQLLSASAAAMAAKGSVQSLSYNQNKNEMTVEILLRNYDQVEQIEVDLAQQGLKSEMISAGSVNGGINARLKASF